MPNTFRIPLVFCARSIFACTEDQDVPPYVLVAVGPFSSWKNTESEGTFTISRSGDLFDISGIVNHKVEDKFDFNAGERFPYPPELDLKLGKRMVEFDDLNLLESCRGAKPFL